jgi:hypothetical protein
MIAEPGLSCSDPKEALEEPTSESREKIVQEQVVRKQYQSASIGMEIREAFPPSSSVFVSLDPGESKSEYSLLPRKSAEKMIDKGWADASSDWSDGECRLFESNESERAAEYPVVADPPSRDPSFFDQIVSNAQDFVPRTEFSKEKEPGHQQEHASKNSLSSRRGSAWKTPRDFGDYNREENPRFNRPVRGRGGGFHSSQTRVHYGAVVRH